MDGPGGFFVIGLGYREDAGGFGGPLYLEELEGGEFALPVFFGPGTLERYAEGSPTLQGSRQEPWLRAGRYHAVRLEGERELFEAAWAGPPEHGS